MKKLASCSVIPLLAAALLWPGTAAAAPDLKWRGWDEGLRESSSSNLPVLVDVYTDWCGWCRRMDRDVYALGSVRDYLSEHFVTVKLNAESGERTSYSGHSYTARTLAARFRVSGYPTTIFLRPGGEHLVNVPGYVQAPRFLQLLRYIGDGYLDRGVRFDDFLKQHPGDQPR
jgi:thioredoxin-related protein